MQFSLRHCAGLRLTLIVYALVPNASLQARSVIAQNGYHGHWPVAHTMTEAKLRMLSGVADKYCDVLNEAISGMRHDGSSERKTRHLLIQGNVTCCHRSPDAATTRRKRRYRKGGDVGAPPTSEPADVRRMICQGEDVRRCLEMGERIGRTNSTWESRERIPCPC